jgi:hypothetical protein
MMPPELELCDDLTSRSDKETIAEYFGTTVRDLNLRISEFKKWHIKGGRLQMNRIIQELSGLDETQPFNFAKLRQLFREAYKTEDDIELK